MKKILKSPWTISIATAFISFFLTVIYDLLKGKQVFSTVSHLFLELWNVIIAFLCFDIKVWWIIIGICIFLLIIYLVSKVNAITSSFKLDFITYTEDRFKNWKWSWNWEFSNYQKKWHISNLVAHCPKCDTPMLCDEYEYSFQCPRCKFNSQYNDHEKSYEVKAVIVDNLKRKKQSGT